MAHWLDLLPSNEKSKIRAKLRSPEAYERLRETVKGPKDLEKELKVSESYANLRFNLETEPKIKEKLKNKIKEDIDLNGIEEVLDSSFEQGKINISNFDISIEENIESHQDQIVITPEGNISEKIPIKPVFTEKYLSSFG